ncbi:pyruvate/2-oxoglutarate dehydrogenase complex dihydrolipoamide dehydrogenase (E3) component [Litorimonas taeanensis]|uniref:Pyruvate/2-oxoglutarate dehydrogenase complex dihydrolipoamide dehydrogenase (E3) component n=1 Tax=Litorimonas taeanensis TaxID=568099 RepID=A0A420WDX6_9PROT|nr:FAD-dependent oxidoreductase [Litorimonas taeanensis]RKQ69234.1 pyruvate/2-oxoglutarate dehydrogenase complex dihydrolipoamide dehydrogenase (E3) component [Litorimonas taeanensis]
MTKTLYNVDICVIGAGSAGLSVASGAAQLGRSVVLFEAEDMGGDCLNTGCVPSKAMIAAGKAAHAQTAGKVFGIKPVKPKVDFEAVKAHVKGVIETIAPVDSQERFEGLGCTVIREYARFKDTKTIESDTTEVIAKRFVIATGSRASAPPIPGLSETPYLTNENIFTVDSLPKHLLVIGAGPIGLELGQAFRRLGSDVTIIDVSEPLGRSEPEHAKVLVKALEEEGVTFRAPVTTKAVRKSENGVEIELESGEILSGSHLLVAAGRKPSVSGLNLEAANVQYDKRGIEVDPDLRTSNKRIYAAGDVAKDMGGLTHAAGHHASALIKNFYFMPPALGRLLAKATTDRMPAAIYSEPELGSIGLTEAQARKDHGDVKVVHWAFDENDRAIAERNTQGGLKIVATPKGKILGASCVGEGAGDIIQLISLAMANGIKIRGLTAFISPYPTRSEIVKRAAGSWYTDALFSPKTKKLAGFFAKFH